MGSTVTKMTARWRKATGSGVNAAMADQLEELLTEWRSYVVAELRGHHPDAAEHVEAGGLLIDLDPDTKVWSKATSPKD